MPKIHSNQEKITGKLKFDPGVPNPMRNLPSFPTPPPKKKSPSIASEKGLKVIIVAFTQNTPILFRKKKEKKDT